MYKEIVKFRSLSNLMDLIFSAILVYIDTLIIFVVYLFAYHVGIFMQKKSLIIV